MCSFLQNPFIVPLGAFAMVATIVWVTNSRRTREKELEHDLRTREMEHEQKMKELENERLRLAQGRGPSDL